MEYIDKYVWYQEGPGVRKQQYTSNGIKLLNVANLVDGKIDLSTSHRYISEEEATTKYKHFLVDEGDLIIASSGIQVNYFEKKMGFVKKEHLPLCMNTSTIRFKVLDSKITNINYFMWFLKSDIFKNQLRKLITGSAQLNFGPSHLKKIKINMPSLKEQLDIVKKLENVQEIIDEKNKQIQELDKLIKSQFVEMFGNNKEVENKKIVDICSSIVRGPFGSALKKEFFVEKSENTYKVYEQKNAINGDWKLGTYYIDEEKFNELKRFECKAKDIIMSCSGTIGRFYQFPDNIDKGVINQALLKFTINEDIVLSQYFIDYMKMNLDALDTKGSGLQNIGSVSFIKEMEIPVPKIELQTKYLNFVKLIDKQKFEIEKSLEELKKLKECLMEKYFM